MPRRCPAPAGRQPCVPEARFPAGFLPPAFRRRASRPRWRSRCLWIQGSVLSRRLPERNRYSRLTSACPGALHRTHSLRLGDGVPAARGARPPACSPPPSVQGDVHRSQLAGVGTGTLGCSVGEPGGAARAEPLCAFPGDGRPRRAGGRRSGARSARGARRGPGLGSSLHSSPGECRDVGCSQGKATVSPAAEPPESPSTRLGAAPLAGSTASAWGRPRRAPGGHPLSRLLGGPRRLTGVS